MQVVESINKARERGIEDDKILAEIENQNPEKSPFFQKARERGAASSDILNEIIKQNTPAKEQSKEEKGSSLADKDSKGNANKTSSPLSVDPVSPIKKTSATLKSSSTPPSIKSTGSGEKTLLTKEAQEAEEEMRSQFLKRIEAKERGENVGDSDLFSKKTIESTSEEMTGEKAEEKPKPPLVMFAIIGILIVGATVLLLLIML